MRAKDMVWNQLLLASARSKNVEGMDPAALAELQLVQRVGHARRRRWINDRYVLTNCALVSCVVGVVFTVDGSRSDSPYHGCCY